MAYSRKKKIWLSIAGLIAVGVTIIYFSFDIIVGRLVRNKLTELIDQTPNRLYEYEFGSLNMHLFRGSISLHKIGLIPAEHVIDSIKRTDNNLRSVVKVTIDEVEMIGFEIRHFLKTGAIDVDKFIIIEPEFDLYINPKKTVVGADESDVLGTLLTKKFVSASLNKLEIRNGKLSIDYLNDDSQPLIVQSINFSLTKASADQETIKRMVPFDFEEVKFSSAGIEMILNEDFKIISDSVSLDFQEKTIEIDNVQLQPQFSREAFAARYDVQKQWLSLKVDKVKIEGAQFKDFYTNGDLRVKKIVVSNANLALYKDKTKPVPPFKKKPLPGTTIRNIPFTLDLDSVLVKNCLITINEKSPLTQSTSNFTINDLNAIITRFTNDPDLLSHNPNMVAIINANIMNAANTHLKMVFDLLNLEDSYKATGHVDSVEANVFNDVMVPMASVRIEKGLIQSMDFEYSANDTLSTGTMDLEYKDIKVEMIKTDSKREAKRGFMSFAANTVIKSHNSKTSGKYIEGIILTKRILEKNLYPYIWHSIESGLISTLVPITNKKEAKEEQKEVRKELKHENKEEHKEIEEEKKEEKKKKKKNL